MKSTVNTGKCKICKSPCCEGVNWLRFVGDWSYERLIETYRGYISNLNKYNLSNHFSNHISPEDLKKYADFHVEFLRRKDVKEEIATLGLGTQS